MWNQFKQWYNYRENSVKFCFVGIICLIISLLVNLAFLQSGYDGHEVHGNRRHVERMQEFRRLDKLPERVKAYELHRRGQLSR